jgi:homoserine O-acetyltransferase/O-succinyltransferase
MHGNSDIRAGSFTVANFRLENATVMPEATIAYDCRGTLDASGGNAVLLTHGFSASHHMMGPQGTWGHLAGPGAAIDTNRYFTVASNMLGSSYGSTGPASVNPATGRRWGPDFPDISVVDIVMLQRRLLEHLGVRRLVAVAGPSYGGFQAFQWGVSFPDFVGGIVAAVSAPKMPAHRTGVEALVARLARDPNWNGGWYYDKGGIFQTMVAQRIETLTSYGIEAQLAATLPDPAARAAAIRAQAEEWARVFDGNSLVVLRRASMRFNAEKDFARLKAPVLYVLSRTDKLFPPALAPEVMAKLEAAGVPAEYLELDSDLGHLASGLEWAQWAPALAAFMARVDRR